VPAEPSWLENRFRVLWSVLATEAVPVPEYKFDPERKWRFDFAWPDVKVAVELEGAVWKGRFGGHTSGKGYLKDIEKYNRAASLNWLVLRYTKEDLEGDPQAMIDQIERTIRGRKHETAR
jgi:very-short-patch-repair endonuclease